MGKKNKSKRFIQQGADSIMKHDARFPYRGTLAEAEKARSNSSLEGFKWGTYYSNKLEMLLQVLYLVQVALNNKISYIQQKTLCNPLMQTLQLLKSSATRNAGAVAKHYEFALKKRTSFGPL